MMDRARILQTKFLIRPLHLLQIDSQPTLDDLDRPTFNKLKLQLLEDSYEALCAGPSWKLISTCRPEIIVDPILLLPMTNIERSQVLRWRLGSTAWWYTPSLHMPSSGKVHL
ncbi:hypothetical protein [Parasitella parasitica]|uniref:Uncharacterized protein n=1 Tax=Parasitella parasitica TaxID=35722 RepID=A0A0B7N744_9FUNG|nr:hypothetical protein [Parasitella parasitica]